MSHRVAAARTAFVLTSFAALVCLIDLCGWWMHKPLLVGIFPDAATMKPNTAVGIFLLAASMMLNARAPRRKVIARVINGLALVLFAATLLEYLAGVDLRIDRLLFDVPWERAGDPIGRMSLGTAIDGVLLGSAALLVDVAPLLAAILAGASCSLSLSALVGFVFDAAPLLGVPALRSMAVRTAASFFMLGLAHFLMRPEREPLRSLLQSTQHHRTGFWFVLGTCALPIVLGWPVAALYHHGWVEASFAFAVLVVGLVIAQIMLVVKNSQSFAAVEQRRHQAERERQQLAADNEKQHALVSKSERRAAQSEAQYRLISDALPALVAYIDRDVRYVNVNRTYETWFGMSTSDITGRTLEDVLGQSATGVRPHFEAALSGTPQQFETSLLTLQGERIVQISQIPDLDTDGTVRGVVVQANDITGRKRDEAALRQTEKLAAVGKLASSIAHEINNPLEAVTNLLYLAKASSDLSTVGEYLRTAEEELKRVSAIASQTLRFHKQTTNPSRVEPRDLFRSVLVIYGPRLAGAVSLEERHRPSSSILCMDGEIRQVLNNLVGNALDAMCGTGGRLTIRSRAASDAATGRPGVAFTVADTGCGMDAKTLSAIFEAFFTTKGMSGTGLGLWVSKEIVDRHGGSLKVRSSQHSASHGTVFRLFLPCVPMFSGTSRPLRVMDPSLHDQHGIRSSHSSIESGRFPLT